MTYIDKIVPKVIDVINQLESESRFQSANIIRSSLMRHLAITKNKVDAKVVEKLYETPAGVKMRKAKENAYNPKSMGKKKGCDTCGDDIKVPVMVELPKEQDIPDDRPMEISVPRTDEDMVTTFQDVFKYTNANQVYIHFGGGKMKESIVFNAMKEWARAADSKVFSKIERLKTESGIKASKVIFNSLEVFD